MNSRLVPADYGNVILSGIVGSTAYGLAHAGSDRDRLGVYTPTVRNLLGLHQPRGTFVNTDPDVVVHELGKYLGLALRANPTATEMLWLDGYDTMTDAGAALVGIREALLSTDHVRNAYLGYARAQFTKLQARDLTSFSAGGAGRVQKHARHMFRLLEQAHGVLTTGQVTLRVADRDWYLQELPVMPMPAVVKEFERRFDTVNEVASVLPDKPDLTVAETLLIRLRVDAVHAEMPAPVVAA